MILETWYAPLLGMDISLLDKIVRTVAVYLAIAVLIRIAGKRLLAQMNNLDLVVVLLLSNVVQNAIIGPDNSVLGGLVGAVVLILANQGLDRLTEIRPELRWLVEGSPTQLITDGELNRPTLHRLGLTEPELAWALQHVGAESPDEVQSATLQPGGTIVLSLKADHRTVTHGELRAVVDELKEHLDRRLSERPGN